MTALRTAAAAATILAAAPALAAKKGLAPGEQIDLNRATVAELMRLPGVGEQKARAVVEHRQRRPFRRPEEVMHVKGFGRAWFQRVKGNLVAGPVALPGAPATPSPADAKPGPAAKPATAPGAAKPGPVKRAAAPVPPVSTGTAPGSAPAAVAAHQ